MPLIYQHILTLYHLITNPSCVINKCVYIKPNFNYVTISRSKELIDYNVNTYKTSYYIRKFIPYAQETPDPMVNFLCSKIQGRYPIHVRLCMYTCNKLIPQIKKEKCMSHQIKLFL